MLGLALEGGGAKGAFEIGAYRALTELGYRFDVVAGVSIGAINAALIAQGDCDRAAEFWETMSNDDLFSEEDRGFLEIINRQVNLNTLSALKENIKTALESGGIDTSRIRAFLEENIDPERLLQSPMDYGMIAVAFPELQPLIQRMAELNRREFTANVAHELKTPLTSIVGYAEIMKQHVAPERDWPELVEYIYAEGKRMIRLVEDILLISRLDGGSARSHCEVIELRPVAQEVAERFRPAAAAAQVELHLEIEAARIFATRQIAEEILSNLIDNAIKYNREGGSVTVEARETGAETLLTVRDTGIGIRQEDQPRIFERFFRVDKSRSKATGGTGLGLSIVKHAVQLLGGSIDLQSEANVGTEITVHFPWQAT